MSEVSNGQIYNLLINMRGDLGRLEGKMDGHAETLKNHIADDKITDAAAIDEITKLRLAAAKQRGFVAALAAVGGAAGTAVGLAAEYFFKGHS